MNKEIEVIEKLKKITSFVELKQIFSSWEEEQIVNGMREYIIFGYASLISYPSIILTNQDVKKEIEAAEWCYNFMIKYEADYLKNTIEAAILILPPIQALLYRCSEFFQLNILLQTITKDLEKNELAAVDGNLYAEKWKAIFEKGYHGTIDDKEIESNFKHMNESFILIKQTKLSNENTLFFNEEQIKTKIENFYKNETSNKGCSVLLFLILSVSVFICFC